jgi:2-C-methyl-D-erythritol 4-phosphate cytidylyltransferase
MLVGTNLKRVSKPENAVKNYFSKSGLWQVMKPQTRKHHIDRLTAYIAHIKG